MRTLPHSRTLRSLVCLRHSVMLPAPCSMLLPCMPRSRLMDPVHAAMSDCNLWSWDSCVTNAAARRTRAWNAAGSHPGARIPGAAAPPASRDHRAGGACLLSETFFDFCVFRAFGEPSGSPPSGTSRRSHDSHTVCIPPKPTFGAVAASALGTRHATRRNRAETHQQRRSATHKAVAPDPQIRQIQHNGPRVVGPRPLCRCICTALRVGCVQWLPGFGCIPRGYIWRVPDTTYALVVCRSTASGLFRPGTEAAGAVGAVGALGWVLRDGSRCVEVQWELRSAAPRRSAHGTRRSPAEPRTPRLTSACQHRSHEPGAPASAVTDSARIADHCGEKSASADQSGKL